MRKIGENKKGQQMTLGTIIAIVLGIAVLVFLIYGFSTGWNSLWNKVTTFGGGDINVGTIKTACTLACQQDNEYGFCVQSRTVNYGDKSWEKGSCKSLEGSEKINIDACDICAGETIPPLTSSEQEG